MFFLSELLKSVVQRYFATRQSPELIINVSRRLAQLFLSVRYCLQLPFHFIGRLVVAATDVVASHWREWKDITTECRKELQNCAQVDTGPRCRSKIATECDKAKYRPKSKVYGYSSSQCHAATPLRELTCHIGSCGVTCHPTEVTFPPLPQPKLVLD